MGGNAGLVLLNKSICLREWGLGRKSDAVALKKDMIRVENAFY